MAGVKQRYTVQYSDGTMRTVVAQSYQGAKKIFQVRYSPPKGECIVVWPQSDPSAKRNMRT